MIDVQGLRHRYGPVHAVEELDFRVERGEILGLLGPNGAGKSTTMRAVVGLLSPTAGTIRIDGHDLANDARAARAQVGYLPEAVPLYRELKVTEFLRFAARAKQVPTGRVAAEVDRVVEACGLGPVASRLIGFCSRGYRQRVGLAQALVGDPPALILDEPTVGLDPAQVVDIRDTIAALAHDKAVILSTHILPEANLLCSRVLILSQGRCFAEGTPEDLSLSVSDSPRQHVVCVEGTGDPAAVLAGLDIVADHAPADAAAGHRAWTVDLHGAADPSTLVRALVEAGCAVAEIRPERLGLEEVFLRLVREEGAS